MKQEEINKKKQEMYTLIKQANEVLDEIRKICQHPITFVGDYQSRIGHIQEAEICSDCGEFIKYTN